jgi:micrococcal nuclease
MATNKKYAILVIILLSVLYGRSSIVSRNAQTQSVQTSQMAASATSVLATSNGGPTSIISVEDGSVPVVRVVDGDTIVARIGEADEKVRLIGMDSPETVDPRKPVQCFGKEASDRMKELLKDGRVILKSDPTQGDRDKYGRLLRYAYLPDGTSVNKAMIEEGYAHEYTYRVPYQHQKEFKKAEQEARTAGRGLWAPGVCEIKN